MLKQLLAQLSSYFFQNTSQNGRRVYIRPSFLSSRQTQLFTISVLHLKEVNRRMEQLWGGRSCQLVCSYLEAGRKEGFSFPPGVWARPQPILPSCFKHCLSLFRRSLSLLRRGMLKRTSAVSTHRTGSETHAQGYTFMPTNLIKPNGGQTQPRVMLTSSHTAKQTGKKPNSTCPPQVKKQLSFLGTLAVSGEKRVAEEPFFPSAVCSMSPILPKPCRLPRGSQKTSLQCLGSHENVQARKVWSLDAPR